MPTHVYQPTRNPPRWYHRVLVHPLENAVAVLAYLFGLLMFIAVIRTGFEPSASLLRLPAHIGFIVSCCCALGGFLSLLGLHWTGETVSRGWAIERLGWLLITGGLSGYTVSVLWNFPGSTYSWLVPLVLAVGTFIRFISLVLIERNTRRTLMAVREETRGTE